MVTHTFSARTPNGSGPVADSQPETPMSNLVSLHAVIDEMEMLSQEGMHAFLHRHTGELYGGTADQLAKAEESEDEDLLDWEVETIHRLREILESSAWLELPHRDSHADYRMMERFCLERCEGRFQEEFLLAITGRGAFRRFRDLIHQRGIWEAWYAFRRELLAEEAKAWLEAHAISFGPSVAESVGVHFSANRNTIGVWRPCCQKKKSRALLTRLWWSFVKKRFLQTG
jgi:hypothetical protein